MQNRTEYTCFKQKGAISTEKLVDQFKSLGNNISSTESDISIYLQNVWNGIEWLSNRWKSNLSDKIKRDFFQAVAKSIRLYEFTTKTRIKYLIWTIQEYCELSRTNAVLILSNDQYIFQETHFLLFFLNIDISNVIIFLLVHFFNDFVFIFILIPSSYFCCFFLYFSFPLITLAHSCFTIFLSLSITQFSINLLLMITDFSTVTQGRWYQIYHRYC